MKTANYSTGVADLIFVVVPKDAYRFKDTHANGVYFRLKSHYEDSIYFDEIGPDLNYTIISTLSNITEEQCNGLVMQKSTDINDPEYGIYCWFNYMHDAYDSGTQSFKDSLGSAVKASKLEVGEDEDILILELKIEKS